MTRTVFPTPENMHLLLLLCFALNPPHPPIELAGRLVECAYGRVGGGDAFDGGDVGACCLGIGDTSGD